MSSNIARPFAWSDAVITISKFIVFIVINKHNPLFTTMKTTNFEFVITVSDQVKGRFIFDDILNQRN